MYVNFLRRQGWFAFIAVRSHDNQSCHDAFRLRSIWRNAISGSSPPTGKLLHMKSLLSPRFILVLCEGNLCRSPIAEGLLRAGLGLSIRVESAGLAAREGMPPHPEAVRLLAEHGIDIRGHRSRSLTPAMALEADLILVMDEGQKAWCGARVPATRGRIHLLGCWLPAGSQEIADPFGREPEAFMTAFKLIQRSAVAWRDHLGSLS